MNGDARSPAHGGNVEAVAARYGVDGSALLDFSANINPFGPPPQVVAALTEIANDPQRLTIYPEPSAAPLRRLLAERFGIDADVVAVGNGAAAVLQAALRACGAERCVLPVPAFGEYRRIASVLGMTVDAIPLRSDFALDVDAVSAAISAESVLVLSNPHNPSGALLARAEMEAVIDRCEERRAAVIVDEAFIDYAPLDSVFKRALRYDRAIVVRSMTKFYAMPGIRVGYALSRMASALRAHLPTWPIGAVEIAAATAALGAAEYEREAISANAAARARLAEALAELGIAVARSSANFLLLELTGGADEIDDLLVHLVCDRGIVIRDCRDFEGLANRSIVRVAVRSAAENRRLLDALGLYTKAPVTAITSRS